MAADPHQGLEAFSVGSWEGEASDKWYDGVYSGIHQIIVVYGDDAIDSIHIEYDNNGSPCWREHGESTRRYGNKIVKIRFRYPHEILTSISGHYDTYLRSLTFESNLKEYGPYGSQRENNFKFPNGSWKIVGFYGRSHSYSDFQDLVGSYFYCIGVSLSAFPKSEKPRKVGPWGYVGGKGGDKWDDGVYSGIHQIIVVYDEDAICSIDIQYDNNGSRFWLEHGGSTGNKIEKIQLDYPREILTSISGKHGDFLRVLTLKSNLREFGPYGLQGYMGIDFSFPISDGKIVGFHGRGGEYLRCIGVYLSNLHTAVPPKPISVGPWGGEGGDEWDDGVYLGIHQIIVGYDRFAIGSIRIEYDKNGSPVWSEEHGGSTQNKIEIPLDYPREILTSISGYYNTHLRSLTFESNLQKYGPFGRRRGQTTDFSFPISDGKIVGFHGRSGSYVDCIGVYL